MKRQRIPNWPVTAGENMCLSSSFRFKTLQFIKLNIMPISSSSICSLAANLLDSMTLQLRHTSSLELSYCEFSVLALHNSLPFITHHFKISIYHRKSSLPPSTQYNGFFEYVHSLDLTVRFSRCFLIFLVLNILIPTVDIFILCYFCFYVA